MAIKNKKLNYLLLPLVLGIWGIALFRMLGGEKGEEDSYNQNNTTEWLAEAHQQDTFTLALNYRDPFLSQPQRKVSPSAGGSISSFNSIKTPASSSRNTRNVQIGRVVAKGSVENALPPIRYLGGVKKSNAPATEKLTGILMIDGTSFRVQAGDSVKDFYLLEVKMSELRISNRDSTWTVYK